MAAIATENLTKYYGESLGMKDVSLEVKEGEIFGFIGPNGAGKSTAIRVLLGLLMPTKGKAHIFGEDVFTKGPELRKRIGYLPSEVNYYEEMSSRELLHYHAGFYENVDTSKIEELAERFELNLDKLITDLSTGNKKKCAIIQTVLHNPDLMILDEPTSGLDPLMQNRFFELLEEHNKRGATIFFSSHILSEIQRMCDRAAIIRKGEITAVEEIQSLLKKQMKKVRLIVKEEVKSDFKLPEHAQNENWHENKLTFDYVGEVKPLLKWMSEQDLHDAVMEEPDLESIFMNYYER